jgi:23S rRNA (uridine2552-2'-O)-methyltransferase
MALAVACETLRLGGALVVKVFMGGDFPVFRKEMQAAFDSVQVARPEATRERSYEVYVVGKGFRGDVPR